MYKFLQTMQRPSNEDSVYTSKTISHLLRAIGKSFTKVIRNNRSEFVALVHIRTSVSRKLPRQAPKNLRQLIYNFHLLALLCIVVEFG